MFKKKMSIFLVIVLVASLMVACGEPAEEGSSDGGGGGEKTFISIATGGTSGTYYPLGGAIAKIFNDNVDGVQADSQSTGASVENIGLIADGKAEVAFIQSDVTYYAATGTENFEDQGEVENLSGMAMFYPEVIQIIANGKSDIKSVEDLKDKKVAIGAPGSGTEANARQILAAHGMDYDDLGKADFLSFGEAADQLKNNQIDAAFVTAGIPTSAVTEVSQTSDIVVVPIDKEKVAELNAEYPFYTEVTIPSGTYTNDEDLTTTAVMAMLVVPKDLDEDLVYNLTKQLFEQRQTIIDTHDRGNDLKLETAIEGMPVDVHAGSQKYYDEEGIE
ncbi:MAG: TAXI family TRAP transporter solute-binding subunit [Tissierella sp.]|uniref:TAXI family TRAP transporter solute-binding subunit n=1 Tax=Tissierella sp. TaxID=41274 RepID=UPI003F96B58C